MLIDDFNHTMDSWIDTIEQYSYAQLCAKPSPERWSMGQMIVHIIIDTNFYIEKIKGCLNSNDNIEEEPVAFAKTLFLNNAFPNEKIEGDPSNAFIPQPNSKEQLMQDLLLVKKTMNDSAILIAQTKFKGKTKHPGLGYFSAGDWLQFADIHMRHHLRQKERIDRFLMQA